MRGADGVWFPRKCDIGLRAGDRGAGIVFARVRKGILSRRWKEFGREGKTVIEGLRKEFNRQFDSEKYSAFLSDLNQSCGSKVEFRVAETPVFLPLALLERMAAEGAELARMVMESGECLAAAEAAIPAGYRVAGTSPHPHFLTADFALIRDTDGALAPRLVEIQAFPSVYG